MSHTVEDGDNKLTVIESTDDEKGDIQVVETDPGVQVQVSVANIDHTKLYRTSFGNAHFKFSIYVFYIILFPIVGWIFEFKIKDLGLMIAVLIGINVIVFWTTIAIGIISSKHLHRIRALLARHESLGIATFCYGLKENTKRPIESISELLALRGTYYPTSQASFSSSALILVSIGVLRVWPYLGMNEKDGGIPGGYIGALLIYIMLAGFTMTTLFQLNIKNKIDIWLHNIGFVMMMPSSISIGLVYKWNIFSILWSCLTVIFVTVWWVLRYKCPRKSDDINKVNNISKLHLAIEFVLGVQVAFSGIIYLWKIGHYPH